MADAPTYSDRLRTALDRISAEKPGDWEEQTLPLLRRSVERTLIREEATAAPPPATFRFQVSGGKPMLFYGIEALPMEADRLYRLLNTVQLRLQGSESLDLEGGLASWLVRPEVTFLDTQLRNTEENVRKLKSVHGRDRDHAAAQAADSLRIRLRSKVNQLIAALQAAHKDSGDTTPLQIPEKREETTIRERPTSMRPLPAGMEPAKQGTAMVQPPAPSIAAPLPTPPPPPPQAPAEGKESNTSVKSAPAPSETKESNTSVRASAPPPSGATPEQLRSMLISKALRKALAAVQGSGFKAIVIGDLAHQTWGATFPIRRIELLVSSGEAQREKVAAAARGESLQVVASTGTPTFLCADSKLTKEPIVIELLEAVTAFHRGVFAKAIPDLVAQSHAPVASIEDLIILRAASTLSGDREMVIDLLVRCVNRLDAGYLKKMATVAGVLEPLKSVWQEAKSKT